MRIGVFLFGGVEMSDAGAGPPAPTDRRYSAEEVWATQERLLDMGVKADELGYDSYWLTEHHFQHEGYEVLPNALLFGAFLAERTKRIKIGALFNIIPQWHPLRFAEDFATLLNLSHGRAIMGIGRGTVPRETQPLTDNRVSVGSFDNPDSAAADKVNREVMEEAMEVIRLAYENERFAFHGKHFDLPPPGIPDRDGTVQTLTLVPRPKYPFEVWQAITSPPTLDVVPKAGYGGVFWNQHHSFIKRQWDRFEQVWNEHHAEPLPRGEKRMLVLNVRIEDSWEQAYASLKPGHDEFWKFLGPYGWSRGYMDPDTGKPVPPGLVPTLDQSLQQRNYAIGTPQQVAEAIHFYQDLLDLEELCIFPNFPGDSYDKTAEQMARFAHEVRPLLHSSSPTAGGGAR